MKNKVRSGSHHRAAVLIIVLGLVLAHENSVNAQITTMDGRKISPGHVNSIAVDNENSKWFSTNLGILSFDGDNWKLHDDKKSLPKQDLKSLTYVAGPEGPELWIASPQGATVSRLPMDDQTEAVTYSPENAPLLGKEVLGIAAGENGIRWIGTARGVSALRTDEWLKPDYDMHYPESVFELFPITSMATNRKGDSLYVGSAGGGIARIYRDNLDGISGASVYAIWGPIDLPSDNVRSVYIASDGTKWFGTEEGIARHTGGNTLDNWTVFTTGDGLVDNNVQAICGDRKGDIWFGTLAGISVYTGSSWNSYTMDDGLVSNHILSLAVDHDGCVWIGTDAGISSCRNEKFVNY